MKLLCLALVKIEAELLSSDTVPQNYPPDFPLAMVDERLPREWPVFALLSQVAVLLNRPHQYDRPARNFRSAVEEFADSLWGSPDIQLDATTFPRAYACMQPEI